MPNPKKPRPACLSCGREVGLPNAKFCSNKCQHDYAYKLYISEWRQGKASGSCLGECVSPHVRRYLHEKYNDRCAECGWDRKHPITHKVPLQIHHIDGDADNNAEENLQLLCPNCHSLTFTFGGLNRGNGRAYRYKKDKPV